MSAFRFVSSRLALSSLGLAAVMGVTACSDSTEPTGPQGAVLFINGNATTANASLQRDGSAFIANVAYGTGTSKATAADTALHTFRVVVGADTTTLGSTDIRVKKDSLYTVVFVKRTASTVLLPLPFIATAPTAGKAKVRIVNYATAAVDVYVTDPATDIATATATFTNVLTEAATAYTEFTAGTKRIRLTTPGTKTVVLDVNNLALTAGRTASVLSFNPATAGAQNKSVLLPELGF